MEQRRLWITVTAISVAVVAVCLGALLDATQISAPAAIPLLALGGVTAAGVIIAALWYPDVAVVLLIAADTARLSDITVDFVGVGVFQPLLALAIVSLSLAVISGRLRLKWSPLYLFAIALAAAAATSVLVAGGGDVGMEALVEFAKDLVYLVVVVAWATTRRSWRLATGVLVGTIAALGAVSVVQEFVLGNSLDFYGLSNVQVTQLGAVTLRHSGPEADPNFWSRSLALALPIALSWWAVCRRTSAKWLVAGAVIAIALGQYLTQSRGGLIATAVAVGVWLIFAGRRYARLFALAPVALAILLVIPGVGSRLVTLTDIGDAQQGAGDPSLQGRVGAQEAGIGMFLAEPVIGIGFGEFRVNVPEVQRELGIQAEVLDAHNLFLEIAAETGLVGLFAWTIFIGFAMFATMRVLLLSRRGRSGDDQWNRLMAAGILAGISAWLAASVFLHAASLRVLFTVIAVGVGMDTELGGASASLAWSRHDGRVGGDRPAAASPPMASRLQAVGRPLLAGALVFVLVVGVGWLVVKDTPQEWVAERQVVVTTGEESIGPYAPYSQDLISRGLVGATYAAVFEDPEFAQQAIADLGWTDDDLVPTRVSAAYVPSLQLISIRVVGENPTQVNQLVSGVVAAGSAYVDGLAQPYVVDDVGSIWTGTQPAGIPIVWRAGLVFLAAVAAATGAVVWTLRPGRHFRVPQNKALT